MRVNLQPAYVLHSRPYRDTSALIEVFTAQYGRLTLVARGARRQSRKGSAGALLQSFVPLLLSFSGRSELKTLVAAEGAGSVFRLRGEKMFSGLYLNELLVRLLQRQDPNPTLFAAYSDALEGLTSAASVSVILRRFEMTLLHELGYSLQLDVEGVNGAAVVPSQQYYFNPDHGLVPLAEGGRSSGPVYPGEQLLAMARDEWGGDTGQFAKRLLRQALAVHLGDEPLHSRALFRGKQAGAGSVKSVQ